MQEYSIAITALRLAQTGFEATSSAVSLPEIIVPADLWDSAKSDLTLPRGRTLMIYVKPTVNISVPVVA